MSLVPLSCCPKCSGTQRQGNLKFQASLGFVTKSCLKIQCLKYLKINISQCSPCLECMRPLVESPNSTEVGGGSHNTGVTIQCHTCDTTYGKVLRKYIANICYSVFMCASLCTARACMRACMRHISWQSERVYLHTRCCFL